MRLHHDETGQIQCLMRPRGHFTRRTNIRVGGVLWWVYEIRYWRSVWNSGIVILNHSVIWFVTTSKRRVSFALVLPAMSAKLRDGAWASLFLLCASTSFLDSSSSLKTHLNSYLFLYHPLCTCIENYQDRDSLCVSTWSPTGRQRLARLIKHCDRWPTTLISLMVCLHLGSSCITADVVERRAG